MLQIYKEALCNALGITQDQIKEYPSSITDVQGDQLLMCKISGTKKIVAYGNGEVFSALVGSLITNNIKLCPLTHINRLVLNRYLPYTTPTAFGNQIATFGVGDRLGLATSGHIHSMKNSRVKPILAQQSKRELNLTGRNYEQVLDDVCFAVFQEGYQGGFGADGDHLKQIVEIEDALECGYTMITLDCSEKIGRGIEGINSAELLKKYECLPLDYRQRVESYFLNKNLNIGREVYSFTKEDLVKCVLIYRDAVDFVRKVYFDCLLKVDHTVDFELSIDETESITTAHGHIFVAMELIDLNVAINSLAPRFVGEFQKGIDYIGNLDELEMQMKQHAEIADYFGHKLSIHSGSDKFTVFPMIGKYTNGRLHIKTSGTNWLEAIATIAECKPSLYRQIHKMALKHFDEATSFYHVSADLSQVVDIDETEDKDLIQYLNNNHSRQLLHITYGYVLNDAALHEEIYETLKENEDLYNQRLVTHIGRHLTDIGLN